MHKRGQLTIFIIIGILILLLVLGGYYLYSSVAEEKLDAEKPKAEALQKAGTPVIHFIENCLRAGTEKKSRQVSNQGGYYELPFLSTPFTTYYYYTGYEIGVPSTEVVENELSTAINEEFPQCIDNFSAFKKQGYAITAAEPNASTSIGRESILIQLKYPISISKNDFVQSKSDFSVRVPSKLGKMLELSREIVQKQYDSSNEVLIGELIDLGIEEEVSIQLTQMGESDLIYTLVDQPPLLSEFDEKLNLTGEKFSFAMKYNWSEVAEEESTDETLEKELEELK